MKTLIKNILTASVILNCFGSTQAQTNPDTLEKKIVLGIGGTYTPDGYGGMIKFDYLKNQKLSFGVRSHITSNIWENYTQPIDNTPGSGAPGYTATFHPGHVINVFLTSTYFLLGNNFSSKAGVYLSAGLGYQDWTMSETVIYTDPLYDHNSDFSYRTFSGMICLGGNYKLGPGKLFLDIPLGADLYERYDNSTIYKNGITSNTPSKGFGYFAGSFLAINLGYAFSL